MTLFSAKNLLQSASIVLLMAVLPGQVNATDIPALGSYNIDEEKISVSGISSGAFMANQLHIALSDRFIGAGMVAGGLYNCTVDSVTDKGLRSLSSNATGRCMSLPMMLPKADFFIKQINELAEKGWIAPTDGLKGDKVYLFTGKADSVVNSNTVEVASQVYSQLGLDVQVEFSDDAIDAGHSWLTDNFGNACDANEAPFINDCDYDQAEIILTRIYGELQPKATGELAAPVMFSQDEFVPSADSSSSGLKGATANGLLDYGYIYAPEACKAGGDTKCGLHVALHGCSQSAQVLQDEFVTKTELNAWAETNNIVVLYPQASKVSAGDLPPLKPNNLLNLNPYGCWNWWGYSYDNRFSLKDGVQITAITGMIDRVVGQK